MTNEFQNVFAATHNDNTVKSDKNKELARVITARLSSDAIVAMLAASNVNARDMSLALYTTAKTIKLHAYLVNIESDFCENLNAAIRTIALCYMNDENVTERDIAASILIDVEVSDERKHLVYKRANRISADAQRQYVIAALRQMQIISEVSKNVYRINANATFLAVCDKLAIELVDASEVETEMLEIAERELVEIVDSENVTR